jgi:hypothetical protein
MAYEMSFIAFAQDYPNDAPVVYFAVKRDGSWASYLIAVDEHFTCLYSSEDIIEWSTNYVFYRSIDGGVTWVLIEPDAIPWEPYKLSVAQPSVFYATDATNILASDNLANWTVSHARGLINEFYPHTSFRTSVDNQDRVHTVGTKKTQDLGDGLYRYYYQYVRSDDNCASATLGPVEMFSISTFHYNVYPSGQGHSSASIAFHGIAADGHDVFAVFKVQDTWNEYNMNPGPYPVPPTTWWYTQHSRRRLCLAYSHDDGATWNSTIIWETCQDTVRVWGGSITYPPGEFIWNPQYGALITLCPAQNTLFVGVLGVDDGNPAWGINIIHRFKSTNIRSGIPIFSEDINHTTFDTHEQGHATILMPQLWDDPLTAFMISYYFYWLYGLEDELTFLAHTVGGSETALTLPYKDEYAWGWGGDIPARFLSGMRNRSFWW